MVVFLFLSLRNTDGTVFQGANSPKTLARFTEIGNEIARRYEFVVNQLE
jgi:hypothetical protein